MRRACGSVLPPAVKKRPPRPKQMGPVTLDTVFSTEPPSLDPSLGSDTQSVWAMRQMFMGLTGFNEDAEVVPVLGDRLVGLGRRSGLDVQHARRCPLGHARSRHR